MISSTNGHTKESSVLAVNAARVLTPIPYWVIAIEQGMRQRAENERDRARDLAARLEAENAQLRKSFNHEEITTEMESETGK